MAVKFNYIEYSDDFFESINEKIKKSEENNILLVFEDFSNKKAFIKRNEDLFIYKNCEYFTIDELKKKLYVSDKILINKDTSLMGLFSSIPDDLKKEMGIKDYFSCIDFGNRFFTFFKELGRNNVIGLSDDSVYMWEKPQIDLFYQIKKYFDKEMEKNEYYPSEWLENINNFDNRWGKKYEKIIFVDIVSFTNLDKKIIKEKLDFINFEFYLQMNTNEFDEEKLCIRTINFPNSIPKIDFYNVIDNTTSAFNLVNLLSKDDLNIGISSYVYSPLSEDNNYSEIFPKFFDKPSVQSLDTTKFYQFLELQMILIDSVIKKDNNDILFKIEGFINCFNKSVFRKYYGISNYVELQFLKFVSKGYKYLSSIILEEYINKNNILADKLETIISQIIDDISCITNMINIDEVYNFYKKILYKKKIFQNENIDKNLEKKYFLFYEDSFKNIASSFNEIATNIKDLSNNAFFGNSVSNNYGAFIYKLFFDKIKNGTYKISNNKESENLGIPDISYTIRDIKNGKYSSLKDGKTLKKGYFIDLISTALPNINKENIIFTENQLKNFGFISVDEKRNIEKYRFIQNIYTFNELVFFSYTNDEEKIEYSSFVEEIKLKSEKEKDIIFTEKRLDISNDDYIKILANKFLSTETEKFEKLQSLYIANNYGNNNDDNQYETHKDKKEEILFRKNKEILNGELKLGAYAYNKLDVCNLRFYLEQILKLEENFVIDNIKSELEPITRLYLGNFVHGIMEKIIELKSTEIIENNDFNINKNDVYNIISNHLNSDIGKKLPFYIREYFDIAMIPKFANNIINFFKNIKEKYNGINILSIDIEKNTGKEKIFMDKNNIEVKLDGNVDLLITTDKGHDIYDHKTGKAQNGQMDFYKIALFLDSDNIRKFVFNGWDGELIVEDKDYLTKEEMESTISKFIIDDILSMAEPNSKGNYPVCKECLYKKICGRG